MSDNFGLHVNKIAGNAPKMKKHPAMQCRLTIESPLPQLQFAKKIKPAAATATTATMRVYDALPLRRNNKTASIVK